MGEDGAILDLSENAQDTSTLIDEAQLVKAAQRDRSAFGVLYTRYLNAVYRYCLARTGDVTTAQDLTSQTFLAALEHLSTYRGTHGFHAWVLGIARHKIVDHFRMQPITTSLDGTEDLPSLTPSPDQIVEARLQLGVVLLALHKLVPERAEVLALRVFGGLHIAEISAMLEKSEAAVKMLLHRALRDLRAIISVDGEEA